MVETILDSVSLLVMAGAGAVAAVIAAIVASRRKIAAGPIVGETVVLTLAGAFLARTMVAVVLDLGGGSYETQILVGWAFLLWPGAVDTVAALFGAQFLTQPDRLLALAAIVGGVAGLFDGIHRIRAWPFPSLVTFVLDCTWGLAGTTDAMLLHLVNLIGRSHAADGRQDAHRYTGGFHIKRSYAFTQGAVMSTLPDAPGTPLYAHERVHVLQSRAFGPFFILSYLGWMALLFIPALVASAIRKARVAEVIEAFCYYDNPWEAWGYKVQERKGGASRTAFGTHVWSDGAIIASAIVYFIMFAVVTTLVLSRVLAP